jgi:hypothetical protein
VAAIFDTIADTERIRAYTSQCRRANLHPRRRQRSWDTNTRSMSRSLTESGIRSLAEAGLHFRVAMQEKPCLALVLSHYIVPRYDLLG